MRRKIAGTVGSVLLCVLLLAGCSDGASTADSTAVNSVSQSSQQETVDTTATSEAISKEEQERNAALEETEQKFKSAENYQESGDYYKAYTLYQKIDADDSNYNESQKRAAEMLDLYWKQQDTLIEQGDYQTALDNAVQAMNFANMTSFSGDEDGLESTILTVAEKIAGSCGFDNPKGQWDEIYSLTKFKINMNCTGIAGKSLSSLSNAEIISKYNAFAEQFHDVCFGILVPTFGEIHSNGAWYSVENGVLSIDSDKAREKAKAEEKSKQTQREQQRLESQEKAKAASDQQKQDAKKSYSGKVTQEYQNALTKGLQYANQLHMSKKAVYDQLTSSYGEGFPADAAQYAVDHMTDVDWNANALAKAEQYYYSMSMSKSAVYDQLTSSYGEQFTASQAQYAIDHLD